MDNGKIQKQATEKWSKILFSQPVRLQKLAYIYFIYSAVHYLLTFRTPSNWPDYKRET